MTARRRRSNPIALVAVFAAASLVTACAQASPTPVTDGSPATSPLTRLTVGLGFTPSVQFAQFYLAQEAGYYRAAGLDVTLQNKIDPELITLIGQGAIDIGSADGTSVIPAVSQGIPVRYVATIYATFPNVVFSRASSGINTPADLRGKRLGTPGKFGSSWIMLQALLRSAGLTPDDVQLRLYPDFGQRVALEGGAVDAATGFVNNEPVQMELSGEKATLLRVDRITPLPGPGLVTGANTLQSKRDALRAFVAATLHAMDEIRGDPEKGLQASIKIVPELGKNPAVQRAILKATVETWDSQYTREHGLGAIDHAGWATSVAFMRSLPERPVARAVEVDELVSDELLPR